MGPDIDAEVRSEEDRQHVVARLGPGIDGGAGSDSIRYVHHCTGAFGSRPGRFPGINAELVLAQPMLLDGAMENAVVDKDFVALCHRGKCTFLEKARNAQTAGACAVIIASDDEKVLIPDAGDDPADDISIPVIMISRGEALVLSRAVTALQERGSDPPTMQISIGLFPPDGSVAPVAESAQAGAATRGRARTASSAGAARALEDECDTADEADAEAVAGIDSCLLWSRRHNDLSPVDMLRAAHAEAGGKSTGGRSGDGEPISAASYDVPMRPVPTVEDVLRSGSKRRWTNRPRLADVGLALPAGPGYFAEQGRMLLRPPADSVWIGSADGSAVHDSMCKVVGPGHIPPGQVPDRLAPEFLQTSVATLLRSANGNMNASAPQLLELGDTHDPAASS